MSLYRGLLRQLACGAPSRFLPKRIKNRLYSRFIHSLTNKAIRDTGATAIFDTRPLNCDPHSRRKVWMVTSKNDLLMAFWSLKSLLYYSRDATWDVHLADGGGLDGAARASLGTHFPGIQIHERPALDRMAQLSLVDYPLTRWLRFHRRYVPALKLVDVLLTLPFTTCMLLDSDVLFFSTPHSILRPFDEESRSVDNSWRFNTEQGKLNSGLGIITTSCFSLSSIESILKAMSRAERRNWTVEQDVYTRLSGNSFVALPADYAVEPIPDGEHSELTTCHYIGVCRHRFFTRGITRLHQQGLLNHI